MDSSGQDSKKYALRIYTIIKNGPLDKGGASELSDFIIPPEEVLSNQTTFEDWVQTHSNQEINLSIYSLLTKKFREIKIKTNPLGSKDGILGASVRKENWTMANKRVLHIISVKENSFAQKELGLIPYEDFIVGVKCQGTPIIALNHDEFTPLEILQEVVRKYKGKPVKFYIYNKIKGARDVTAFIGNDYYFSLGCEGAFGALHMFPSLDMEKNNINNEIKNNIDEVKKENKDVKNDINSNEKEENLKEIKVEEIKDNNYVNDENKDNNKDNNNNTIIKENNENSINIENKEKSENILNKEENQTNKEIIEEIKIETKNENNINDNNVNDNNNNTIELKKIESENKTQNNNDDKKPSENNINQIVEEISVEKDLESNNSPKKEENNQLIEDNKKSDLDEKNIIKENDKQDIEIKEETKEEIKKVELLENIITNKEEKNNEENNSKENNKEEIKGEEKNVEEDKNEENAEEVKEENTNNINNVTTNSGNKNKRRKKRNKH